MIDPAELVSPSEVAELIGLGNPAGVSVYRRRYADFPRPLIEKGRCILWSRQDVEQWAHGRGRASQAAIDRAKEDAELVAEVLYLEEANPELAGALEVVVENLSADIDRVLGPSKERTTRRPRRDR